VECRKWERARRQVQRRRRGTADRRGLKGQGVKGDITVKEIADEAVRGISAVRTFKVDVGKRKGSYGWQKLT